MLTIRPLQPAETEEARRMIYRVAHEMFHSRPTLAETIAFYEQDWPLRDVLNFQQSYNENGGTFLVMEDGGRIIGTGALRCLEDGVGEIKRLWLLPEYQGQGLGYRLLQALIAAARERGYTILRLETSPAYQPRAYAFYQQLGFVEIPRYGDDPDDVGMELVLGQR